MSFPYSYIAGLYHEIIKKKQLKINEVKILRSYKDSVIINEGLSEGDLIIKTPLSAVKDGMSVRLKTNDGGQKTDDR